MALSCRLLLAALLLTGSAAAQTPGRVDPHLRWAALADSRATGAPPPRAGLGALCASGEVAALVRVGPGGTEALRAAGARLGALAGDVVSARIPLASLGTLAADPRLRYLEAAAWLAFPEPAPLTPARLAAAGAPLEDGPRGVIETGADRLRARLGDDWYGLTGEGVLVGIFDSGVDLAHPDFLHPDGSTRVLHAWDQEGSGPPVRAGEHVFDYGVACTSATIDAGLCPLRDRSGHGTHVAGIAAGDGSATGNGAPAYRFPGMAPGAGLLVVRGGDTGADAAALLDGVAWMVAQAEAAGLPLVVNLSIATQSGPHDGTTLLERGLDALAGPGRLFVTVSGNQGNNANESPPFVRQSLHAQGTTPAAHGLMVPAYTPAPGTFDDGAVLELWYDGGASLAVQVVSPGGHVATVATGDSAIVATPEGAVFIDNASGGPQAINGDRVALITVFDLEVGAPPARGRWEVRALPVAGGPPVPYHLWLVGSSLSTATELTTLEGGITNTHLVGTPGGAARVLTVGAYTQRHDWWGLEGSLNGYPFREALGDLAHFSSPGPLRVGDAEKPELAAPGKLSVSSLGADATLWANLAFLREADGVHAALLGTSMAAPYATGAAALLLQRRPTLAPEAFIALLSGTARTDAFTERTYSYLPGGRPNVHWGWGKLDARAAVRALGHAPGGITVTAAAIDAGELPARAGATAVLLRLDVAATNVEPVEVVAIPVQVAAGSAAGRLLVVLDEDGDGSMDPGEQLLGAGPLPAGGRGSVALPGPVVPAGMTLRLLVAVELAEPPPHGTVLEAAVAGGIVAEGVLSGAVLPVGDAATAPGTATVTVLAAGAEWSLSENPVRGERLVVNFRRSPRRAAIYTAGGALVRVLEVESGNGGRAVWMLDDREGRPVATGVYLLLLDYADGPLTRKIFVVRGR